MRTWKKICEDQSLRDLPYKIETNRVGQLILSPRSLRQGSLKAEIGCCSKVDSLMGSASWDVLWRPLME
jgi:hypothetical protein